MVQIFSILHLILPSGHVYNSLVDCLYCKPINMFLELNLRRLKNANCLKVLKLCAETGGMLTIMFTCMAMHMFLNMIGIKLK